MAVVRPRAPTPARCSRSPGWPSSSSSASTASPCARSTSRASPRRTPTCAGAKLLGVRTRRRRPCSRTPSPAWRPATPATSASWSASIGVGPGRAHCASTAPTSSSTDLAELLGSLVITHEAFPVEPWQVRETTLDLDSAGAVRIAVRAVQRAHRLARQPRRGRAARAAGHLPQLVLRDPPAALRRGRRTAIPRRARPSSTSPTARSCGCSSTTNPSTSATASCVTTSGCSTCAPGTLHRSAAVALAGRAAGPITSTRLVSLAQRGVAAIEYVVEAVDEFDPGDGAVRARRQRGPARDVAADPARRGDPEQPAASRRARQRRARERSSCTGRATAS